MPKQMPKLTESQKRKGYNRSREAFSLLGSKKEKRRKYKQIIEELGARQISLENIMNGEKMPGFLEMIRNTDATFDDAVILQQYGKAILQADTSAATFLRDTVGEKPTNVVDITEKSGLKSLSDEELKEFYNKVVALSKEYDNGTDESDGNDD